MKKYRCGILFNHISKYKALNIIIVILLFLGIWNLYLIVDSYNTSGYLPAPFLFNKNDTFMDFYNSMYWGLSEGAYSTWRSVYPPLNFIILYIYSHLIMGGVVEAVNPIELRDLYSSKFIYVILSYIVFLALTIRTSFSSTLNRNQMIAVFLIFLLSPPSLFALERGNLIFISLYFFALYIWGSNKLIKIIAFAVLVNLKPYFIVIYLFEFLNPGAFSRNKEFFILGPLIAITLFLGTGIIVNHEYYLVVFNLLGFGIGAPMLPAEVFSFASSITSFDYLKFVIPLNFPSYLSYIPKIIMYAVFLGCIRFFFINRCKEHDVTIFSVLFLTNFSIITGGYSTLFYIPILPLLYRNKDYAVISLLILGCFVGFWEEIYLYPLDIQIEYDVYLSGKQRIITVSLTLANLIRPLLNFAALILFYRRLNTRHVY